jgi:phage shock protein PspC (stress-responsive transcriptional regulator)
MRRALDRFIAGVTNGLAERATADAAAGRAPTTA